MYESRTIWNFLGLVDRAGGSCDLCTEAILADYGPFWATPIFMPNLGSFPSSESCMTSFG